MDRREGTVTASGALGSWPLLPPAPTYLLLPPAPVRKRRVRRRRKKGNVYRVAGAIAYIRITPKARPPVEVMIDKSDLPLAQMYTWSLSRDVKTGKYYVETTVTDEDSRPRTIKLARHLMGVLPEVFVDHRNHNLLDNRRRNLRPATRSENGKNRSALGSVGSRSGVPGVQWRSRRRAWVVYVPTASGKRRVGTFARLSDATAAREAALCAATVSLPPRDAPRPLPLFADLEMESAHA